MTSHIRIPTILGGLLACFTLSGCVTFYMGSAPKNADEIYVVGARNNLARVWKCPAKTPGECKDVEVTFK